MSLAMRPPRIPDTGNTFAELVYHLTSYRVARELGQGGYDKYEDWPTVPHMLACALVPISRKLHKLAEDYCNAPMTPDAHQRRYGRLMAQAKAMLPASIKTTYKPDPRAGYGLGLIFPDGRTNDFGQTCVVVPTKVTA